MRIIFYENRYGDFIDKVIRFKTASWQQRFDGSWRDLPSHVELLFSDDMMFSASQYENKTRFKRCNPKHKAWNIIDINIDKEKQIKDWCTNKAGKKYDYIGILGFIIPFINDNPNRYFCSEVCCMALQENTDLIPKDIDSAKVSPAKLKELIFKGQNNDG